MKMKKVGKLAYLFMFRMNGQFFAPAKTELPPSMAVVSHGAM